MRNSLGDRDSGKCVIPDRLWLQHVSNERRTNQGELVRGRQPIPAPCGFGPNLVNTVKGFAAQEQKVLLGVTEARAKVGTIQATPELINDAAAFKKFQAAQGDLSQALSSLIAVTENYPQLKSDANFRDLQAQLEGTENRIAVARNRYITSVQAIQRHGALLPLEPDGDGIRLQSKGQLYRRQRTGNRKATQRGVRAGAGQAPGLRLREPRGDPR